MSNIFGTLIILWTFLILALLLIGGYFMFRKFLKSMPKEDGLSDLDWQDYYIEKSEHLWSKQTSELLDDLVQPVPELFRDVARRSIAARIGELALEKKATAINQDLVIQGYILATPARDHKWLVAHLDEKQIDYSPYKKHLKIDVK